MKKITAAFLAILLFSVIGMTAFGDYREITDEIDMTAGLNPVVTLHDGNSFDYTVYACHMEGMTNGDFIVTFDPSLLSIVSFDETGNYDLIYPHEEDGNLYISFIYNGKNELDAVKMFVITFASKGDADYPLLTVDHLAGTFINSVAETVIVDGTAENGSITDNNNTVEDKVIRGDVDGNGKITAADARLALRIAAKTESPDERQWKAADVNGDGIVTSSDARAILRFTAGLQKFN